MKPWMIAVLAAVALILLVAAVIWLRSRTRKDEEPQVVEGAAAGALAADSGDEAGADSGDTEPTSGAVAAGADSRSGDAPPDAHAPDLLTSAEQITDEEIDAGRTAALKKMLEERGRQ